MCQFNFFQFQDALGHPIFQPLLQNLQAFNSFSSRISQESATLVLYPRITQGILGCQPPSTLIPGYPTGSLILINKIFWDKRVQRPELNLLIVQSKSTGTVLDLPACLSREGGSSPNYTIKGELHVPLLQVQQLVTMDMELSCTTVYMY